MPSDIEIAQKVTMRPIVEVASSIGIGEDELELYGPYKAKVTGSLWERIKDRPDGKLILVTAITPTPAGEGKTTTSVGLGQGLAAIGKKAMIALREPSLGPSFGVKGGAAGGGYSQVVPMEDINLHFTGDIHAVTTAHNLVSAMIDNHLQQGNELGMDPRRIVWRRVLDLNERALRSVIVGLGGKPHGVPRESGFDITVASELMAILCLSTDLMDLKERVGRIIIGYTYDNRVVKAGDLGVAGSVAVLLKDAIKPNLVQTLEGVPAFVHGGPFANIAHGCNSIQATRHGLKLADYFVTEAGFGAELGAEKFFDIKCRMAGLRPDAVVLVASVRALKMHGGLPKSDLSRENVDALKSGLPNLEKHIENLKSFGVPVVVAVNRFPTDSQEELDAVMERCEALGASFSLSEVWGKGGQGGIDLARKVVEACTKSNGFRFLYDAEASPREKIETIARGLYGAGDVQYTDAAEKDLASIHELGLDHLLVCMAKTQASISDDPAKVGRPDGFTLTVREVRVSAGAGFIVPITGSIMTMPGLPKKPAALDIDIDAEGRITGLF
ncbi:MAG TPA: formate--tetrahydrofolate ligase [Synergistales bacterium]|nr:formate--tetrahydrofolate ligase [Synergistales bacterium]MDD3829643.1 formate--tetrahydrofolate ligase [Synergistales bacterium]NLV64493.1 formate--tetrahydrofolate ligase [Synergistaceae bacterium]HOI82333.1 formate--tetrahydrofolate ligase [Synergistales bacterium]